MNQTDQLDSVINNDQQLCRRYRNVRPHSLPAESHSFVGMARETAAMPPASWKGGSGNGGIKPFGTGGDTHTHGAASRRTCEKPQ